MRLQFSDFLCLSVNSEFWEKDIKILCFKGKVFPGAFLRKLRIFLRKSTGVEFCYLNCNNKKLSPYLMQGSLLGDRKKYWLGEIDDTNLLSEICSRRTDNCVSFFTKKDLLPALVHDDSICIIDLIDEIDLTYVEKLLQFFDYAEAEWISACFEHIVKRIARVTLDQFVWLLNYIVLAGFRNKNALERYCTGLLGRELSLKSLSDSFILKNSEQFFCSWDSISSSYTMPFWVSFFMRVFWDAASFVELMSQRKFSMARQFGFRFPSLFRDVGWKHCSVERLSLLTQLLFNIDCSFKTGICSDGRIEEVFISYFEGNVNPA